MKLKKRKPPPDDPANRAGRKLHARAKAWVEACGGIRIEQTNGEAEAARSRVRSYSPPADVEQKVKEILARKAEPKPKPKRKIGPVSFFQFARTQK